MKFVTLCMEKTTHVVGINALILPLIRIIVELAIKSVSLRMIVAMESALTKLMIRGIVGDATISA